ncbi:hypothetical protein BH23PLA1_BH23PLA1_14840 [soil metagenome]
MPLSDAAGVPENEDGQSNPARPIDDRHDRLGRNLLNLGDAVIVTDERGKILLLNPEAEILTGWTDDEAKDQPIETVFHIVNGVARLPVIQPVQGVIEQGVIQSLPQLTLLIAKDGSELAIDDSASPIRSEAGVLDGVILIFRDVSEHRHQENLHEETRRQSEVIIASVHFPMIVLDGDHLVRTANHSFYDYFQTVPEETIGRSLFDLGNGHWNHGALRTIMEDLLTPETFFGELEIERDFTAIGPRTMNLKARKLIRKEGGKPNILLAIHDITERRRLERSFEASELRYRRLFEAAKDGILILDGEKGTITAANPFLLELLGYSHAELVGKQLWEIGLLGDKEASLASFRELQEKGYVRYDDLPLEANNGRSIEVEVVSNVYRANDQMIIQCNIRDVTERKQAEMELRRAKELAEEGSRAKDLFLSMLSHELRTPLTPVLATVSYIELMPNLPEKVREEFASIRRNVELEARLIDDLLDLTRFAQGKLEIVREIVDAHVAIRHTLDIYQAEFEAKKLEISLALRAVGRLVWADPARLQQILWNLIKNAVKFTPVEGTIRIRTTDTGTGRLSIEIVDTGEGIDPTFLPRIFDVFEQGNRDASRRHGGLGMGLAIAKKLVDLHSGSLTVASEGQGQGSTFRVELEQAFDSKDRAPPLTLPLPPSPEPARPEQRDPLKLLLVEDNPDTLRAIALLLGATGFVVKTATSVKEAIAMLATGSFQLLISDIGLPDGSGLEIMRLCRDSYGLKGIAFSGYATHEDRIESILAGFSHHLAKPLSLNNLVSVINQTVN